MSKRGSFLNIRGIIILAVILAVVDLGTAYILSPLAAKMAQTSINTLAGTRVDIGTVRVHPLLLSVAVDGVEVRDPDNVELRLFRCDKVSANLDPIALLKKEIAFAVIRVSGAKLELVRDASGRLNIEKLGQKTDKNKAEELYDQAKAAFEKRDWFKKAYEGWKNGRKKKAEAKKADKILRTNALELPRGSLVEFRYGPEYAFRAGLIRLENADIAITDAGSKLPPFRGVDIEIRNLAITDQGETRFSGFSARGVFEGSRKGDFDIRTSDREGGDVAESSVHLKDIDLAPLKTFYEKSLPVTVEAGYLSLDSKSRISGDRLDSSHKLKLDEYRLAAKQGWNPLGAPAEAIVAALNRRPTFELSFEITGDPDKPSFSGFNESLMRVVGDDLKNAATDTFKEKAGAKAAEWSEKVKSLF